MAQGCRLYPICFEIALIIYVEEFFEEYMMNERKKKGGYAVILKYEETKSRAMSRGLGFGKASLSGRGLRREWVCASALRDRRVCRGLLVWGAHTPWTQGWLRTSLMRHDRAHPPVCSHKKASEIPLTRGNLLWKPGSIYILFRRKGPVATISKLSAYIQIFLSL